MTHEQIAIISIIVGSIVLAFVILSIIVYLVFKHGNIGEDPTDDFTGIE